MVWQSPKRAAQALLTPSSRKIKMQGFLRQWKEGLDEGGTRARAEAVVLDLLRPYQRQEQQQMGVDYATIANSSVQNAPELAVGPAETVQAFVQLLQSLTQQHSLPTSATRPNIGAGGGAEPYLDEADDAVQRQLVFDPQADTPQHVSPPPRHEDTDPTGCKKELYVKMVEREMAEIMALCSAGLLDLDAEQELMSGSGSEAHQLSSALPSPPPQRQPLIPSSSHSLQRQSLIAAEVAAVTALMDAGWFEDAASSSSSKKAKLHSDPIDPAVRGGVQSQTAADEPLSAPHKGYHRLRVLDSWHSNYSENKIDLVQLVVKCMVYNAEALRFVILRREWVVEEEPLERGDVIHLIGEFDADGTAVVDREHNYVIINPDSLVRVTTIGNMCERRSVLELKQNLVTEAEEMVYGTAIHSVFEACLSKKDFSENVVQLQLQRELSKLRERMYSLDMVEKQVEDRVNVAMLRLRGWAQRFLTRDAPLREQVAKFEHRTSAIRVRRVLAVEQSVWSPMWGLKGKVDVVLEVVLPEQDSTATCIVPLELKTGTSAASSESASPSHRGQVGLYTLLLQEHYGTRCEWGLLFHTQNATLVGVTASRDAMLAPLLQKRNTIAYYLTHPRLPPLLRSDHYCSKCPQLALCAIVHKARENGTAATFGLGRTFTEKTEHLSALHLQWYAKWEDLIRRECGNNDELRAGGHLRDVFVDLSVYPPLVQSCGPCQAGSGRASGGASRTW